MAEVAGPTSSLRVHVLQKGTSTVPGQIQGTGHPPHPDRRAMIFIDGTNLLLRLAHTIGVRIPPENPPPEALDLALLLVDQTLRRKSGYGRLDFIRQYWHGSYRAEGVADVVRENLRARGYEAVLVKQRDKVEKGVDIGISCGMLVGAFRGNYSLAILVTGDEDFAGLVEEVKGTGAIVRGLALEKGLSKKLRLAFDEFDLLDPPLKDMPATVNPLIEAIRSAAKNAPPPEDDGL